MAGARGFFITLEGGEGAGKSTQAKLLRDACMNAGFREPLVTREPGGTPEAETIRELLVKNKGDYDPLSMALMFSAARREHIVKKIRPALDCGQWVICDRFVDSTNVYQGCGLGVNGDVLEGIYAMISDGLRPNLTLILDLPVETGLARSTKRLAEQNSAENRFENMDLTFHQRLRQGFIALAQNEPTRCALVDASQSLQDVHRQILQALQSHLGIALQEVKYG